MTTIKVGDLVVYNNPDYAVGCNCKTCKALLNEGLIIDKITCDEYAHFGFNYSIAPIIQLKRKDEQIITHMPKWF